MHVLLAIVAVFLFLGSHEPTEHLDAALEILHEQGTDNVVTREHDDLGDTGPLSDIALVGAFLVSGGDAKTRSETSHDLQTVAETLVALDRRRSRASEAARYATLVAGM